ncbi:RNA polymerase sigma-70 factor, ECF subfamily [Chitinophaga jiangningensis]|uniref:RNA polymerase sigma-70 factor, ECF subfamily n=1 Tax=Chitinophaga jiangningensis TaxID=1419482 RepID=A0A1M7IT45_9BACT|nr:RNA polymerase sigma-70 factor [Chitinophaga jiangningensis]SHM43956.1 RNA polymerase sigma-70 factor, ECF subfamily [Chitinophaga jiangningensis]
MQQENHIKDLQLRIALYEDMKAYNALYLLLFDGLHRFAYTMVKSSEVAEELVSDAFVKLWQIRHTINKIENLKVYLYVITKNFALNHHAQKNKMQLVQLDNLDVEAVMEFNSPENVYISNEIIGKIQGAIRQLPPQCRIIFQLVKEDGLRYKEVAAILGLSVLTVRNQLAIAVKKVTEALPSQYKTLFQFQDRFSPS